ncbi:MAG: hypothetical protein IJW26_06360 [Clostridia bacterium]|nr:hypothetical protein [Clostridia bacterium]
MNIESQKIIENKINQALDNLLLIYEQERERLSKRVSELEIENEKLKLIINDLRLGKMVSRKDFHLHKINE